jgi:hypothetical protein
MIFLDYFNSFATLEPTANGLLQAEDGAMRLEIDRILVFGLCLIRIPALKPGMAGTDHSKGPFEMNNLDNVRMPSAFKEVLNNSRFISLRRAELATDWLFNKKTLFQDGQ